MDSDSSSSSWRVENEIDRICDTFESQLRSDDRPAIATFLKEIDESYQGQLLRELVILEWDYYESNDLPWTVNEYIDQFPNQEHILRQAFREQQESRKAQLADLRSTETDTSCEDTEALNIQVLVAGSQVGQYVIEEEIGAGGVGIVFRARQANTERPVALKFLNLLKFSGAKRREFRHRFLQEPKAVARLDHPNIVTVYEAGEFNGLPFFAMKLVRGPTLRDLTENGPIDCKKGALYVKEVALAIEHAHQHKVLHRDIKPGNVLVDSNDCSYITDFGMAKLLVQDANLTVDGTFLGTVGYVSPEQANDPSNSNERSDVYGLGATLYCLLTGRPPFQSATGEETLRQVREVEPVSPRRLNPLVERNLETICLKCLEKSPHRRYPTARELAEDLARYLEGEPIHARPVGPIARGWSWCRRRPAQALSIALAASLFLLVAIGGPIWAVQATRLRRLAEAELGQRTFQAARLAMQRGQWMAAVDYCDRATQLGHVDQVEIALRKSDALSALGLVEHRKALLKGLDNGLLSDQQYGRWLLDQADVARLEGDTGRYHHLLQQAQAADLLPADQAFVEALSADSLEAAVPHLYLALQHDPWHFEAFTELLATLLLTDKLEELDFLARASALLYPDDPSTNLAQALSAVARDKTAAAQDFLKVCQETLAPAESERASDLVELILSARRVTVHWKQELRRQRTAIQPQFDRLLNDSLNTPSPEVSDDYAEHTPRPATGSRLLLVLRRMIIERFDIAAPRGIVEAIAFSFSGLRRMQIAKLEKDVQQRPDAATYCELAELLDQEGNWAAAEEASRAALTAPTLFPQLRRYACAYAAALASLQLLAADDPNEKQDHLDRALVHVKRRLDMGPLIHYPTSHPLASIAIEAQDYDTIDEIRRRLSPDHRNRVEIERAATIAAYHRGNYLDAIEFAQGWLEKADTKEKAREYITKSANRLQELANPHLSTAPPQQTLRDDRH